VTNPRPPSPAGLHSVLDEAFPQSRSETRIALASAASVGSFAAGQTILAQGEDSSLVIVLAGHVAFCRTTVDGRQLILRIVGRGELAPTLALASRPAAADAIALTAVETALWRVADVRALATSDPGLAVDILDQVLQGFEEVLGRLDSLHYQDSPRRVARALQLKADLFFSDPPVLTRAHLPTLVGTSREMTGRALRILESRGLVERVGRDRLRLLDSAGLAAVAAGVGRRSN
jgi:CRP/FNR family transcriptional regulator